MSKVIFIAPHQDDELLGPGVPLVEHLAAVPAQDVHVLFLTDGSASGVIDMLNGTVTNSWWGVAHNPADEGYLPLTPETLGEARDVEASNALYAMASGLPGSLTLHWAGLQDGAVTVSAARAAIEALAEEIDPGMPVRLKAPTYVPELDEHPDHRAAGIAVRALQTENPDIYGDCRYYVESPKWGVTVPGITLYWDLPTDSGIAARVRNGIHAYSAWNPGGGTYAIARHSVAAMLDLMASSPKSRYHM